MGWVGSGHTKRTHGQLWCNTLGVTQRASPSAAAKTRYAVLWSRKVLSLFATYIEEVSYNKVPVVLAIKRVRIPLPAHINFI